MIDSDGDEHHETCAFVSKAASGVRGNWGRSIYCLRSKSCHES